MSNNNGLKCRFKQLDLTPSGKQRNKQVLKQKEKEKEDGKEKNGKTGWTLPR
jgi:hypothetical protein